MEPNEVITTMAIALAPFVLFAVTYAAFIK